MQIILAWRDGATIKTTRWVSGTTTADYNNAIAYVRSNYKLVPDQRVYTYPDSEPDPLNRAKTDYCADSTWHSASMRRNSFALT